MFFDKMLDGFSYHKIVVNKEGKPVDYVFLEVNHAFEKMTGLKREQIIGKRATVAIPGIEKDPADLINIYGRVALTGDPVQFENYSEQLDKWFKVAAYCPEKGYFVALLEDITGRKNSDQELWQAKNDWERTFDSVPDLIAILDNKHKIVRANKAMVQQLGVTSEQAIGLNCYTCVHGATAPPEFCPHSKSIKDGKEHIAEVHEPRLGGDFLVSTTPLLNEKGCMVGSVHVARNITQRKKAENALKKSEEELSSLFANMIDGFAYCQMILDETGKPTDFVYLQINDAFEKITGLKKDLVVGKKVTEAIPGIKEANPELFEIYGRVALTGQREKFEVFFKPLSMWLSISVYCPRKGYFAAVFEDISERKQAEEALRESEQRWETTLASIGDAVIATDMYGRIMFMNGVAEDLTGWALSEASQKPVKEVFNIVNEQTRLGVENPIAKVLAEGMVVGLANHTVLIKRDGTDVAIDDSGAPIRDKEGKISGVVLVFRDITERKKQEREIESLAKFPSENPNPIFRVDRKGIILYSNQAGVSLLTVWNSKVGERAPEHLTQAVTDALASNKRIELEDTYAAKTFLLLFAPIISEGYVNIYATDITERKKAEEAVTRQAELIDLSPDAIIVRNLSGIISFWSRGAEKLYGWTKDEVIGQDLNTLLKSEFRQPIKEILHKLDLDGKWSGETVHTSKDGNKVIVQSYWLGKIGADGQIVEMLESNVDITERIRTQTKLEESAVLVEEYANQMEELANRRAAQLKDAERLAAIGATAGMVGHDIRNPLQAITGDVYLAKTELASTPESDEKKNALESLQEIEKNTDYINKIVADLQDFARPLHPHAEETDLKRIIDELLKKNGLPENVKASIKVESAARKVVADSSYINRIMYNLMTNAVQAMPRGGKLTIHAYKEANDVVITVKDTGVGIAEGVKSKLFTPMFTTKSKGQGFGLAVIKRMTEALGGKVTFESQEGKGTAFIIRLPPHQRAKR
jgi:PAS domain S-box-containing protein